MAVIVQKDAPVLRHKAKEVSADDFGTEKLRATIKEMRQALQEQEDGVGLAAPQIGIPLRIFILSDLAYTIFEDNENAKKSDQPATKQMLEKDFRPTVFINPEIIKLSREKHMAEEGCLSVRPIYGKVKRSVKAVIRAYDENGKVFERGGSGLLAQAFQHEVDHLNGILFIDKAIDLHEEQI